jgi:hypothetical protein
MSDSRTHKLSSFIEWARLHVKGDEKGEAHIFLDRLFQAFGHPGSLDVGGEPEFRIRKASEDGGGTAFADFVWKPLVLIEMKKRGTILSKHYRQAFDYWTRLVPGRPRFVILCNFDEFEIYDFETQMDSPVGRVKLADLAENYGSLAFLFPEQPKPVFENEHVAVTREAAAKLAKCFNLLVARGVDRPLAQRFILQILIAFFAEDIGLMERYFVTRLLDETDENTSYDLLGGLFRAMNNRDGNAGGRFKGVPYFNGGVFSQPAELELQGPEIVLLRECAASDWSKVQPEIFGTVFEQTLDKEERHASGAHFTHPADIMKIVGPTIVEPWRKEIEKADTARVLGKLLHRLQEFQVLDPACGSGNFLYIAYREMKRLEARIYERLDTEFPSKAAGDQMRISFLSAQNFHGMDINPFAVELAKVTMMIARKLAIDELHITERPLPLDNLDRNFLAADALLIADQNGQIKRTEWPKADVIIGNPPFLDARKMTKESGREYVGSLERLYPSIPRRADLCVYWINRSHDHLANCTSTDPFTGRAGLVGTQNIRNNDSRVGGLDHVVKDGTILEAVDNQPWSGEANVHVSIANWVKTQDPILLPKTRRLWHKVEPSDATKKQWKKQGKKGSKEYELSYRDVAHINSALSDQKDVTQASVLSCNTDQKVVFEGVQTGHIGFVVDATEGNALISANPRHSAYVKPFINGSDLLSGSYEANPEYVIDLSELDILQAAELPALLTIPKERVLGDWENNAANEKAESGKDRGEHQNRIDKWWALKRPRGDLQQTLKRIPRYVACSAVMKRPIFVFLSNGFLPTNALKVFAFQDDYSFGILQSSAHWLWFITKCSKLKADFRYTPESVFDTFPWPQDPSTKAIASVAEAGCEIRRIREEALKHLKGGLRALYRTLELPGANPLKETHAALDAAVLAAYGFDPKADLLAQLLDLNQSVAAKIAAGQPVTAPGLPPIITDPTPYITHDCIRPTIY